MENLRDILRDALAAAKESGLWQRFGLKEKKELVRYFFHYGTSRPCRRKDGNMVASIQKRRFLW